MTRSVVRHRQARPVRAERAWTCTGCGTSRSDGQAALELGAREMAAHRRAHAERGVAGIWVRVDQASDYQVRREVFLRVLLAGAAIAAFVAVFLWPVAP